MGVPLTVSCRRWDDMPGADGAAREALPLLDDAPRSGPELVLGPERPQKPLELEIPLFVSDMSFGALSRGGQGVALARRGRAGWGPASVPARAACCPRSRRPTAATSTSSPLARFGGFDGQGAALPGVPLQGRPGRQDGHRRPPAGREGAGARSPRCAGLAEGEAGDLTGALPRLAARGRLPRLRGEVRDATGGIPIGFKIVGPAHRGRHRRCAARRGGLHHPRRPRRRHRRRSRDLFKDNISVPTMPALARARRYPRHERTSPVMSP